MSQVNANLGGAIQEIKLMQAQDYFKVPVTPEEDQAMAALSRKLAAQQQQETPPVSIVVRPRRASKPMPRVNRIG